MASGHLQLITDKCKQDRNRMRYTGADLREGGGGGCAHTPPLP